MTTVRGKFRPSREVLAKARAPVPRRTRADRLARRLALAYKIERLIEAGEYASYGEVAKALGLSRPRVSQIVGLLFLAPGVQEKALLGEGALMARDLLRGAKEDWPRQGGREGHCASVIGGSPNPKTDVRIGSGACSTENTMSSRVRGSVRSFRASRER